MVFQHLHFGTMMPSGGRAPHQLFKIGASNGHFRNGGSAAGDSAKLPIPSPRNLPHRIRPSGDVRLSPFLQHDVDHGLPNMFRRCTRVGTLLVDGCVYHLLRGFSQGGDDGSDQRCSAQMKVTFRIIESLAGCGLPLNLSDEGIGGLFNGRWSHKGYNTAQHPLFIYREESMGLSGNRGHVLYTLPSRLRSHCSPAARDNRARALEEWPCSPLC